jgi:hypothetical protein
MTNPYARNIGDRIHGSILHRAATLAGQVVRDPVARA